MHAKDLFGPAYKCSQLPLIHFACRTSSNIPFLRYTEHTRYFNDSGPGDTLRHSHNKRAQAEMNLT